MMPLYCPECGGKLKYIFDRVTKEFNKFTGKKLPAKFNFSLVCGTTSCCDGCYFEYRKDYFGISFVKFNKIKRQYKKFQLRKILPLKKPKKFWEKLI